MKLPGEYTEQFRTLLQEVRRYLLLQKHFVALDVAEKLIVLLSTIAIAVVCFVLGAMILFFLTFALAYWIGQLANSMAIGFLTISAVLALSMFIFYKNRTRWIIHPLSRLVANLFVSGEEESTEEQDENEQTGI